VLTAIAGIAAAVVLALLAIALDAPTLLVAAVSAFGGSAYLVAGVPDPGPDHDRPAQDGPIGALEGRPIALVAWVALGLITAAFQYLDTRRIGYEQIERARYRFG
jgi:hypothetical protein